MAKGYSKKYGTDYIKVFALVSRMDTVRLILAIAAMRGWTVY